MNICFVTAGPIEWASSRMRAFWVAEELRKRGHDVTVCPPGYATEPEQDVYIWQKTADIDFIKANQDKKHYWDVCDPVWWFDPEGAKEITNAVDGVVCSSDALHSDLSSCTKSDGRFITDKSYDFIHTIPDRLKLPHFPIQKTHSEVNNIRFIWFGISANRQSLYSALANLERLKANGHDIALTILDDRPDVPFTGVSFPVYHTRWNLDTENEVIASHDIALLPPYPGPWGKVKSNNKGLTAVACGLPITDGMDYQDMKELSIFPSERNERVDEAMELITLDYSIEKSADDWEAILC